MIGEVEKVDVSTITRVKKTIWRDTEGWRLVMRGERSIALHHCKKVVRTGGEWVTFFAGAEPIDSSGSKCSKCGTVAPDDLQGLYKLHNWDAMF